MFPLVLISFFLRRIFSFKGESFVVTFSFLSWAKIALALALAASNFPLVASLVIRIYSCLSCSSVSLGTASCFTYPVGSSWSKSAAFLKAYGVPIPSAIAISSCLLLSLLISKLSSNYLVLTSYWTSAVLEVFSGFPLGVLGSWSSFLSLSL